MLLTPGQTDLSSDDVYIWAGFFIGMDTTGLWQGQAWVELLKHSTLLDVTAPSRWQKMKESFRWPGPRHSFIKAREKTRAQWQESACQGHPAHEEQTQPMGPSTDSHSKHQFFPRGQTVGQAVAMDEGVLFPGQPLSLQRRKSISQGPSVLLQVARHLYQFFIRL